MDRTHTNRWRGCIGRILISTVLILLIGCGGGDGTSPAKNPPTEKPEPPVIEISKAQLLYALQMTISGLEEEADRGQLLGRLSIGNQFAIDTAAIHKAAADATDDCMTKDVRDATTVLTFDGTSHCKGVSGKLEITPTHGNDPDQGIYTNTIKFVDFSIGDGCPINGHVQSQVTLTQGRFEDISDFTSLDLCGQVLSGQVVFWGDDQKADLLQLDARAIDIDHGVEMQVEMTWQPAKGTLSGDGSIIIGQNAFEIQTDQLIIDGDCGLPTGGTITITEPDGGITRADFTGTTCETRKVTVEYKGAVEQWELSGRTIEEDNEEPIVAGVKIIGIEETVFDWSEDRCIQEDIHDIPDSRARAFRDRDGKIQLISTHYVNRRMIGNTLDTVNRECRIIMNSDYDTDPSKHNDREWLSAFYTKDGNTVYALIHNEYHGWKYPDQCQSGERRGCWYNSVTLAVSEDGGLTYSHATAPNHFVAAIPYTYIPDESPYGILGLTNIIFTKETDGSTIYYILGNTIYRKQRLYHADKRLVRSEKLASMGR
jgi:hypothetical protein